MLKLKQKYGFSTLTLVVFVCLTIPILLVSLTSSLLNINNSIGEKMTKNADQLALAYSEYHRALQLGYETISAKQGKTESTTSVIGDNNISIKYGTEASVLGIKYIPVTITVNGKNNEKSFTLERKIPSTMPTGYTKAELDDILKGYAYNKSYNAETDTNILSIKIADGEVAGTKQVFAYLDGEPIQLATTFDMLGKPDWGHVRAVSFPYTATEDGFLWIHLGWPIYNDLYALNVTTAEGVTLDSLMCYDWGGSNFIILNKGDTVRYKHWTNNENMRYFIPYKKNDNKNPPVSAVPI